MPVEIRKRNKDVKVVLRDKLMVCINKEIVEDTDSIELKYRKSVLDEF